MHRSRRGRRWTRIRYAAPVLAAVLCLAGVSGVAAAPQTTAPDVLTQVKVSITDASVRIARDKFTQGSLARYPRGAIIDFVVTNRGTKPYNAELLLTGKHTFTKYEIKGTSIKSPPIPPGRTAHVRVNFYFRSTFAIRALLNGKEHGQHAPIRIF